LVPPTLASERIGRLHAIAHKLLLDGFAEAGLRPYHYRLLAALSEWGPASQADLSRSTSIDRSDVVAALNQLEASSLVERSPDPDHGRRNIVSLTPEGAIRLADLDEILDTVQEKILSPLSTTERRRFLALLTKLASSE